MQKTTLRKLNDGGYKTVLRQDSAQFLPVYHALKKINTDYVVSYGSGGSGKSHAMGQSFVRRLIEKKEKLLIIRKFGTSLKDSVIDLMLDMALPFWGLREGIDYIYNASQRRIFFPVTGSIIIFRGLDNPEKLKSIAGVTLVWVEEATEILEKEFNIMSDRIRGEPQIYLTFNPISERHWLKARFCINDPKDGVNFDYYRTGPRTVVLFSTYLCNPFVGRKFQEDMEWYRIHNEEHYRVYGLGKWGIIRPDRPYFTAIKPTTHYGVTTFNPRMPICISCDFNVDNTFLISQHYDDHIDYHELIHGGGDLRELCFQIVETYGRGREYRFTGDASGNNQSAYTPGNQSAYELIQSYFLEAGIELDLLDFSAVPTSNGETSESRTIANALISYYGKRICIDRDGCGILIDDIQRMEATASGSLNKALCDKHNYGHAGDAFRYDLKHFEAETYRDIVKNGSFGRPSAAA